MRNNAERLQPTSDEEVKNNIPEQSKPQSQPQSLEFSVPTEFVDLPSGGNFYPDEHPLHNQESLEIRYMTTRDEDVLNNKSLIKKGVALNRMLQGLLVNKDIDINSLLIGDKNAILIAARKSGFGADYTTSVPCLSCLETSNYTFDLDEVKSKESEGADYTENGTFFVELPLSKASVELRLLTGKDEERMRLTEEKRKKKGMEESGLTDFMKQIIVSINNISDPFQVSQFVDNMRVQDSRVLRKAYEEKVPGVDIKLDFVCPSCGSEKEVNVPFGAEFFWPE